MFFCWTSDHTIEVKESDFDTIVNVNIPSLTPEYDDPFGEDLDGLVDEALCDYIDTLDDKDYNTIPETIIDRLFQELKKRVLAIYGR